MVKTHHAEKERFSSVYVTIETVTHAYLSVCICDVKKRVTACTCIQELQTKKGQSGKGEQCSLSSRLSDSTLQSNICNIIMYRLVVLLGRVYDNEVLNAAIYVAEANYSI